MIGEKIAYLRHEKRWTQDDLAKAVRLSRGYIAAIEEGRIRPKIKTLALIAKCLGVELELLIKEM
ncbi:anaerobic benzoate catabolism transcriptional regulator [Desulfosporosinus acididurans]|uniref:Anaerobic benzoate catabolism transcriptional regulator n=1 Tax=Desulfosporosinus acididurans TaxID=476652 RepID=A0A0J1IT47_9FIRM|nr:helix-turn-helix transcriptional regulator [Desulfosporosinus acididurans]KLU67826.1 anaerobic benzoate catabolism transcriptional regulator [Desulfosporosinus acididurans]